MFSSDLLEYISRTTKELEDDSVNFLIDKAFRLNLKLLKQIQENCLSKCHESFI